VRDANGTIHLGRNTTKKRLFGHKGASTRQFTKTWQVLAFIYQLLQEKKMVTQREAYYSLVKHFKNQAEFNRSLQNVIGLIGCTRSSLGICASSSGGVAGLLLWKDPDGEWEDCSTGCAGKRVPGQLEGVSFKLIGKIRYIIVVEKDAVFMCLCNQRIWETVPCILITGCGYPSLSVRGLLRQLKEQFDLPVFGVFDYNPHGVRILQTYKYGSTSMGTESHAYTVNIQWLGIHHDDLFQEDGTPLVPEGSLQPWAVSDEGVWKGLKSSAKHIGCPHYDREIDLMGERKLKAEIEAINVNGFDNLENLLIQKILSKRYY
jgi:meiotic recombination protein SPO11